MKTALTNKFLKDVKPLQKIISKIKFFPKLAFLMFQQAKTQLSPSKRTFHYGNPFDSCLIIKNWNPRK